MGIKNRDGALYWATGIDNTGLMTDSQKSIGIIRGMMKQVSGFDVFAGLGVSAAIAASRVGQEAKRMAEEYEQAMKEVQTISAEVQRDYEAYAEKLVGLSTTLPQSATELAKAYYQIVSAGYDGEAGLKLLEASAKGAVGGVTDVTTAADGMTTVLNAWKIDAKDSSRVADVFFNTVRLGKTTFGELGGSINQVAALAASMGISFEEVMAATASLTKQGAPTAMALTQIRQAIIALSENLGDGWSETYTFQEALIKLRDAAGGSDNKLKEMVGRIEGVNAVLGLTGENAKMAAEDLMAVGAGAGSADASFRTMMQSSVNQSKLLANNIDAALKPLGDFLSSKSTDFAVFMNEAFASGKVEKWASIMGKALAMLVAYTAAAKGAQVALALYNATLKAATVGFNALGKAMLKNPIGLISGALAALIIALKDAGREVDKFSKVYEGIEDKVRGTFSAEKEELENLRTKLELARGDKQKYSDLITEIDGKYNTHLGNIKDEADRYKAVETAIDDLITKLETKIDLGILEGKAAALREEMAKIEDTWDNVTKGFEGKEVTPKIAKELNRRAKEVLEEMFGGAWKVPVNAMEKDRWKQLEKILKDEAGNYLDEYNRVIEKIKKMHEEGASGKLTPDPDPDPDPDKGAANYYQWLEDQIEGTEEKLKSLAAKQGEMDQAAIKAMREKLSGYQKEKEALDLLLGLTLKKEEKGVATPAAGSIKALEEELNQLNDKWLNATDQASRESLQIVIQAKEKELEIMRGVKEEEIKLESNYYDKISTQSYAWLKEEAKRLEALKKKKEEAFNKEGISAKEKKALKNDIKETSDQLEGVNNLIDKDIQNSIRAAADAFNGLGGIIGDIDDRLGSVVSGVGSVVSGLGSLAASGGNPVAVVSGTLEVIEGLISIFSKGDDNITAGFTENIEKINRLLEEQNRIVDAAARKGGQKEALEEEIRLQEQLTAEKRKQYDEYAKAIAKWKKEAMGDLPGDLAASQLKNMERTLKEYENQWKDAQFAQEEAEQALKDFGSGFLTEVDIADKIAEAFEQGKTSIEDFAEFTNDLLSRAVMESFKAQILGPAITGAQEYLSAAFEDNELSQDEVNKFRAMVTEAAAGAEGLWNSLTGAMPDLFGGAEEAANSLQGSISASLTEETGSLLAGRINTLMLDVRQLLEYTAAAMDHLSAIEENTSYNKNLDTIRGDISEIKNSLTNA